MDKLEIKKQIEKLKAELVKHKEHYKRINDNFKRHIADLQKQASYQTNKDAAASIRRQIASKKDSFVRNEKRFEKEGAERIKISIEKLKAKLK
jgi:hypothetical protein